MKPTVTTNQSIKKLVKRRNKVKEEMKRVGAVMELQKALDEFDQVAEELFKMRHVLKLKFKDGIERPSNILLDRAVCSERRPGREVQLPAWPIINPFTKETNQ